MATACSVPGITRQTTATAQGGSSANVQTTVEQPIEVPSPTLQPSPATAPSPTAAPPQATHSAVAARRPVRAVATPIQKPDGTAQAALTNAARAAVGLPPLTWSPCLAGVASLHASEMVKAGLIYHGDGVNRDLGCGLGSTRSGENVGEVSTGPDDRVIFDAFMRSPGHRDNILGPFRYVGVAWMVGADGTGYVSVEFAG